MADFDLAASLIDRLAALAPKLKDKSESAAGARWEALQLLPKLSNSLEDPRMAAMGLMDLPMKYMAVKVAVDLDLYKHIANHHDGGPVTAAELARLSGGEELLISRILRPLSAIDLVQEAGEGAWVPTRMTKAMADKNIAGGLRFHYAVTGRIASLAAQYLLETGHRSPTDVRDAPAQFALQTKRTLFEILDAGADPRLVSPVPPNAARDFNGLMSVSAGGGEPKHWSAWYPVRERLRGSADDVLLVDVGGGRGHDLLRFRKAHPRTEVPGRLILQELGAVTRDAEDVAAEALKRAGVEVMVHDMFAEQPVKGARAYFLRRILHSWPEARCLDILARVRAAMRPGYSRLLLCELVLPETGAVGRQANYDLAMMLYGGMERTERQWRDLLEGKAGLRIAGVWRGSADEAGYGIVEAVLPEGA